MGYLIKAPLGLAMFIGGLVLGNVKLVSLLETGTCASGNTPYQIANPCPSGTGADILLLMASIFGALIGVGLFSARGSPPWDPDRRPDLASDFTFPAFAWGLAFTGTGATALIVSLTDEAVKASNGAQLGGLIVGGTFVVMGLPILILSLKYVAQDLLRRDERPASAVTPPAPARVGGGRTFNFSTGSSTGGQIAKLERLQRLRESGALTDAEFEREKAKVLAE
jgi:hypothetical protein